MPYTDPYLAFTENVVRGNLAMRQLEYAREVQRRQEDRYNAQLSESIRHNKVTEDLLAGQYAARQTFNFSAATDPTALYPMMDKHLDAVRQRNIGGPNWPREAIVQAWTNFRSEFGNTQEGLNMSPAADQTLRTWFMDRLNQRNKRTNRFGQWLGRWGWGGEYDVPDELPLPGQTAGSSAMAFPASEPVPTAVFKQTPAARKGIIPFLFQRLPGEPSNEPPRAPGPGYGFGPGETLEERAEPKPGDAGHGSWIPPSKAFKSSKRGDKSVGMILRKSGRNWRVVGYDFDDEPLVVHA